MGADESPRKRARAGGSLDGGEAGADGPFASPAAELAAALARLEDKSARVAHLEAELDSLRSSMSTHSAPDSAGGGTSHTALSTSRMHAGLADLAMDALSEGISIADFTQQDAPLIYVNDGFCRMTGFTKTETVGHNCRFLQGVGTDPAEVAQLRAAIAAGEPVSVELLNYRKDGTPFQNALSLTPIRAVDGRVTHYVGIQSDVTQLQAHREAELAALKQAAEAEAATAAKSRFLAHMSHEIRTPLNGILAVGQMLAETVMTEEQHDLVATIRTSGETLLSLICDILDFSRIEAQKLLLEERPFSLEDALDRALQICCMSAAKKRINVTCRVDDGVPRQLLGDVGRLQQVLLNALGNSLKFTQDGGVVQLHCSSTTGEQGQPLLHIAVIDNGIGISPAGLAKLFASFSQVDSSPSRKYDGAGLGLAISRRLCEAMGGTMRAESPGLGLGSTFHVTIALKEAPPPRDVDEANALYGAFPCPTLAGRHLLVADTCALVRAALVLWLRAWGAADVVEVDSAAALSAMLTRGTGPAGGTPWDAVITESKLPFLQALLSYVDGPGPACAQDTCADSGGDAVAMASDPDEAPIAAASSAASVHVFALAWPAMPTPHLGDLKLACAPRPSGSAAAADPARAPLEMLDPAEACPHELLPCCYTISKPVRQSRLRDALVAVFGPEAHPTAHALAPPADGLPRPSGRPLHTSNSMASFASCGEAGEAGGANAQLPLAQLPHSAPATDGHAAAPPPGAASLRVMLAEDHLINQKVVVSLLKRYGHSVACIANDGQDALEKLRAIPDGPGAFDVILMDLHMPRMGGMDCAAAIAAEWPHHGTPIIAVTADAFEESRQRCMDAGFAGWLSKPFRVDGMMAVLDGILRAKQQKE